MKESAKCPICQNKDGGQCLRYPEDGTDALKFNCATCGQYAIARTAFCGMLSQEADALTVVQRATLSHLLRTKHENNERFMVDTIWLGKFLSNCRLPTPHERTANLIRYVGDHVSQTGDSISVPPDHIHAIIGAPNREAVIRLMKELVERGTLIADPPGTAVRVDPTNGPPLRLFTNIDLSLEGWERYDEEKRGKFQGSYGFMAMKFGDPDLDPFVRDVVKPALSDDLGYDLVDMRDVSRAGVVDDIMRTQIRDAAFVIADLTHDNPGAYWEAGYAEGLGKPVIYICEKEKFKEESTHFDTNHCMTVPWCQDDPGDFREKLIATLRRSLEPV